jgi:hypothetical protein
VPDIDQAGHTKLMIARDTGCMPPASIDSESGASFPVVGRVPYRTGPSIGSFSDGIRYTPAGEVRRQHRAEWAATSGLFRYS